MTRATKKIESAGGADAVLGVAPWRLGTSEVHESAGSVRGRADDATPSDGDRSVAAAGRRLVRVG